MFSKSLQKSYNTKVMYTPNRNRISNHLGKRYLIGLNESHVQLQDFEEKFTETLQ